MKTIIILTLTLAIIGYSLGAIKRHYSPIVAKANNVIETRLNQAGA